jgi:chromosome partitioning protein
MPKIVLVTHQKGGVGKSTLTFNLAQNISSSANVAVLDFDLQGSLSQLKDLVAFTRFVLVKGVKNDKNAQRQLDNLTKEILTKLI